MHAGGRYTDVQVKRESAPGEKRAIPQQQSPTIGFAPLALCMDQVKLRDFVGQGWTSQGSITPHQLLLITLALLSQMELPRFGIAVD